MTMIYAQTLQSTAEAEFLRYRKITADARDLEIDQDLYDMLELEPAQRPDPAPTVGACFRPGQVCRQGTHCPERPNSQPDATFLPDLKDQDGPHRSSSSTNDALRFHQPAPDSGMSKDNVWSAGRRQEHDALGRIIINLEQVRLADGTVRALRGAGVATPVESTIDNKVNLKRGNPDNLRQAARRKSAAATTRAEQGLHELIRTGQPITFRGPREDRRRLARLPLPHNADPRTSGTTPLPTANNAAGAAGTRPGPPKQRDPHTHRPTRRTATPSPRRSEHSQARTRNSPRREPRVTPPARRPTPVTDDRDALTASLADATPQTLNLR